MAFNNESTIRTIHPDEEDPDKTEVQRMGLPTEAALRCLTEKFKNYDRSFKQQDPEDLQEYNNLVMSKQKSLATMAFSRDRKRMSVLCTDYADDKNILYIKGAPDYMLADKACQYLNGNGEECPLDARAL